MSKLYICTSTSDTAQNNLLLPRSINLTPFSYSYYDTIIEALKISVVARQVSTWSYHSTKESKQQGAQIDLVIDRADNCINLCEIKFSNSVFTITKSYAEILRTKKSCFQEQTKTPKSLFTTLITCYGAVTNPHFLSIVDNQLTMDALFKVTD